MENLTSASTTQQFPLNRHFRGKRSVVRRALNPDRVFAISNLQELFSLQDQFSPRELFGPQELSVHRVLLSGLQKRLTQAVRQVSYSPISLTN